MNRAADTAAEAYYSGSAEYLAALVEAESAVAPVPASDRSAPGENDDRYTRQREAAQVAVLQLIQAYRYHGVRQADLDPLRQHPPPCIAELDPGSHGLTALDLDHEFDTGNLAGPPRDTLRNILARLKQAYCGTLGIEYMHLSDSARKQWLRQRIEADGECIEPERQRWLLRQLSAAETLEKVIHGRFVGQKRFSLEGAESLIPLLNRLAELAAAAGVREVGMGMAHRGRLNVLHNVLGRSALTFFQNEAEATPEGADSGDVKYHQGYAREVQTAAGPIRLALAFNPSHLEIVAPVVLGWVRAQQHKRGDVDGSQVLPLLIHGDAAFAGQGVVMETLNMSATRGFATGGAIHVVVNNQIGFTTSDPRDARSSLYCTDVMKMVEAPVLHVNGDDPEAVLRAARMAFDYRMAFRGDIAIDLVCYRRLGHNEQDEPMVTQPAMYRRIQAHPGVRALHARRLEAAGVIRAGEAEAMVAAFRRDLDAPLALVERPYTPFIADWRPYRGQSWRAGAETGVAVERLRALGERMLQLPPEFSLHPRVRGLFDERRRMLAGERPLDWGLAEALAFASLLDEGHGVRLTGQDSGRGTFFHRHAVLHDQERGRWDDGVHVPLRHLHPGQGHFLVVDSLLSEEAVLAFEYGYASSAPEDLTLWEAQFGDFANGAQVVIDQFIAAGESKWGRMNGLTLLLPHGFEGQGPEHSSARIERFLQLASQDNLQLAQPSTPAQMFHLLRRQVLRPYRKPLVVFTPKGLLRHDRAGSGLDALAGGGFQAVLDDPGVAAPERVRRLVLCSGRVYYALLQRLEELKHDAIALIRIEQLYPFPDRELEALLGRYPNAGEWLWCQDEPRNQGAWRFMAHRLPELRVPQANLPLIFAGRPESPAPATGIARLHREQLDRLLREALGL